MYKTCGNNCMSTKLKIKHKKISNLNTIRKNYFNNKY